MLALLWHCAPSTDQAVTAAGWTKRNSHASRLDHSFGLIPAATVDSKRTAAVGAVGVLCSSALASPHRPGVVGGAGRGARRFGSSWTRELRRDLLSRSIEKGVGHA